MTNVLVTGGAGFIGSHLVDLLVDSGYDVTVLDNLTDQVHDGKPTYLNDDADYVWGDIRDRSLLADLLEDADVLSHQASAVGVGQSMYEIEEYVDTNTLGTARMLDVVVNEEIDLKKIIVASSMSIYGEGVYYCEDCDQQHYPDRRTNGQLQRGEWEHQCPSCGSELVPEPTDESTPRDCNSVYAVTKRDQEELTLSVARAYDIPAVALRYFNVYGRRQTLDNPYTGVCAIFSSRIRNGNPPLVFEDGRQTRDFVHVSDIARANKLAIESDVADEAINVGTGDPTTIEDLASVLLRLYDAPADLKPMVTNEFRAGDIRHCVADTTKAAELLGFTSSVDFEDGLQRLVEWGREQDPEDNFEQAQTELESNGLVGSE